MPSVGEEQLAQHLMIYQLQFEREYRFDPERRWRSDFMIYGNPRILVEVHGGHWVGGRHSRGGKSFEKDAEKQNRAVEMGYRVLTYTTNMIHSGSAIDQIVRMLK